MTDEEAIKLLHTYRHIDDNLSIEDVNEALEKGIEALEQKVQREKETPP